MSLKACMISVWVFITNGPCATMGSSIGSPLNTKTTVFSVASMVNSSPSFSNSAK